MNVDLMLRALDNALARRLTTITTLHTVTACLASSGRGGSALMRRLLDERADRYVAPESGLEARFLSIVRAGPGTAGGRVPGGPLGEQLVWHRPQEVVRRLLAS